MGWYPGKLIGEVHGDYLRAFSPVQAAVERIKAARWIHVMEQGILEDETELGDWEDLQRFLAETSPVKARPEEIVGGRIAKEKQEIEERKEIIAFLKRRYLHEYDY